jgi:glycosidase
VKQIFFFFFCFVLVYACKNQTGTLPATSNSEESWNYDLPEWADNANIFEVNLRQHTVEGTFKAFTKDIPRLKKMKVEILWLMPIFPISETRKKGKLGSYYAVSDFRKVNPEFGTMDDFKDLLSVAHAHEMKVILDWVPNHTGWDHVWITEHPDYYTKDSLGNITDPINYETGESWGWTDVADLNYNNQEMRKQMISDLKYWVEEVGIDGYRMDVAHGVPMEFWESFAREMKDLDDDLFLLAEAQIPEQIEEEYFHMAYGWDFHHLLNEVAKEEKNALDIYKWLEEERPKYSEGILMHFTSNHDENSWAGTVFERMGDAHKAMAVITYTFDGMPLLYSGMDEPMKKRLAFFERDPVGYKDYAYQPFYTKLNALKQNNQALWNGDYGGEVEKLGNNQNVLAFQREKNGDRVVTLVNLTKVDQSVNIAKQLDGMIEVFTEQKANNWNPNNINLGPHSYLVFSNK